MGPHKLERTKPKIPSNLKTRLLRKHVMGWFPRIHLSHWELVIIH